MANELTLGDTIALFNAIEDVLKAFNMHDERSQDPSIVLDAIGCLATDTSRAAPPEPDAEAHKKLIAFYGKLTRLYTYAKIVKGAPASIGRAGAGKGR